MNKFPLTFCILLAFSYSILGQIEGDNRNFLHNAPSFIIKKTNEKIIADGILNEKSWSKENALQHFSQKFPTDSLPASAKTEIYMSYDEQNLYVAVKCYSKGNDWIVPTMKRDYGFMGVDNISLIFDTFNDQTNAVLFGINPLGARREATITQGGRSFRDFSDSWDNKWSGDSKVYEDYWAGEFIIPFKTLRFEEGAKNWRFNAYRFDTQYNEITSWIHIPINFNLTDLTYTGEMIWEEPLKKTGKNISVIPYLSAAANRDYEDENQTKINTTFGAGGDVKIGITSGLNLDLTINPDFSQVEVDRQVTNLSRFEIFFPERRQFFLENADLFSNFSSGRSNPFFSRRIGVAVDTSTGQNIQNTILYGARLSGKLNEKTRLGLLNMQTAAQPENDLPSFMYSVGVLEKNIFARSKVAFMGVNKQALSPENFGGTFDSYNRIIGGDYFFTSKNNFWTGKISTHHAITPSETKDKSSQFFRLENSKRRYRVEFVASHIGAGHDGQVGFVPRKDVLFLSPEFSCFFYPDNHKSINKHSLNFDSQLIYKIGNDDNEILDDWSITDKHAELEWEINYKNFSNFSIQAEIDNIVLFNDFDPTRVQEEDIFLSAGTSYTYSRLNVGFRADRRQKFSYDINSNIGQFFNGFRAGIEGSTDLRLQPYGVISLNFSYNHIALAEPFVPVNLWLIGPKFDFTFSKKLFFSTIVQYNNQLDNLNINARLQWRFKPVSDFFLVYTDNYITSPFENFGARNRAIVAKVTYWLNI